MQSAYLCVQSIEVFHLAVSFMNLMLFGLWCLSFVPAVFALLDITKNVAQVSSGKIGFK